MVDEQHGHEGQGYEHSGVREQGCHPPLVHQPSAQVGRNGLRRHAGRVVEAGILAHVAAPAHLHHHGEGINVDGRPSNASQSKHAVHQQGTVIRPKEGRRTEGNGQHDNTGKNGLLPPHLRGNDAHRQITDDRRRLGDNEGHVVIPSQHLVRIDAVLAGYRIVAHEPQHNRQKDEKQRSTFLTAQLPITGCLLLLLFFNAVLAALLMHLLNKLGFPHRQHEDEQGHQHQCGHNAEERAVGHQGVFRCPGRKYGAHGQNDNAACAAHQVNDGVSLAAEGLHGHVRHQSHSR